MPVSRNDTATVQIQITRDQYAPTVISKNLLASIPENSPVNGTAFQRILANDPDLKVIFFILEFEINYLV